MLKYCGVLLGGCGKKQQAPCGIWWVSDSGRAILRTVMEFCNSRKNGRPCKLHFDCSDPGFLLVPVLCCDTQLCLEASSSWYWLDLGDSLACFYSLGTASVVVPTELLSPSPLYFLQPHLQRANWAGLVEGARKDEPPALGPGLNSATNHPPDLVQAT